MVDNGGGYVATWVKRSNVDRGGRGEDRDLEGRGDREVEGG